MAHLQIPFSLEFRPVQVEWVLEPGPNMRQSDGHDVGDLLKPTISHKQKNKLADAWMMRHEFFGLRPGDTAALLSFLNKWGWWGSRPPDGVPCEMRPMQKVPKSWVSPIAVSVVWQLQEQFKRALTRSISSWLFKSEGDGRVEVLDNNVARSIQLQPAPPYHLLEFQGCEEAIRATITIDLLQSAKFRLCARPDCQRPFRVESQHARKYCEQYCGHLESVRNRRSLAKKEKEKVHAAR